MLGRYWELLKETVTEFSRDNIQRYSAALAYYTAFSIAPLLLIAISVAGLVFGREAAEGRIVQQISDLIGTESAIAVQSMIRNAWKPATGLFATAAGVVTLLLGASGVLNELKGALNLIWRVTPRKKDFKYWIFSQLTSFAFLLGVGFLLLVSLLLSAIVGAMGSFFSYILPVPEFVLQFVNFALSFSITTLMFMAIFKWLPDVQIAWRDVWLGAVVTSALFTLGHLLLGIYLGKSGVTSTFGAAASLAVILVWIYYSSIIVYFGAEFTKVFSNRYGSHLLAREAGRYAYGT